MEAEAERMQVLNLALKTKQKKGLSSKVLDSVSMSVKQNTANKDNFDFFGTLPQLPKLTW